MKQLKLVLLVLLTALIVIVVLQNTETVETQLLWTTVSIPRAVLLVGTGFAGFLAGYVTALFRRGGG
jgi:uncharacterized integral membrane protein